MKSIKGISFLYNKEIICKIAARRKGDPACVIASSEKAKKILGWKAQYTNVEKIIETGWHFVEKQ